ncbi:hypothetical protein GQ43DRAFT_461221 [Delitschia confertaspora ATCC 74209]|uniref:DUF2470 domain-containing protein n=1 Tax=Delitschia confertaspora ATCC 74209 TaxID=1513339 RepID=A0A9P4MS90_9PLEO|nr:hypothetical protein GQ43DRAFT_461221 [Delitschia confertaspora ATCC 74209]
MTTPESQEATARERIIKHMNNDHHDSVRRYIEHHFSASSYSVSDAKMTDISLDHLMLSYSGHKVTLPLSPPMSSLREARERLVQMDKDAIAALGRHPVTLKEYISPYGAYLANFTICLCTYIAFRRQGNFHPGSLLYDNLLVHLPPAFVAFIAKIQPILFPTMCAIHAIECALMARKLERHSVLLFSNVWLAWMLSCFVEGITSFKRIDRYVRKQEKEAAKKH